MRTRTPLLLGALALLASALTLLSAPASALDPKYFPQEAKVNDLTATSRAALKAGDPGLALDFYSDALKAGMALGDPRFMLEMTRLLAKRYVEAFTPPGNADSLYANWREGIGATFTGKGAGMWGSVPDSANAGPNVESFGPEENGPFYCVYKQWPDSARVAIDLNRDGTPEVSFDGREAQVTGGVASVVDRASDGRRAQWLIAPAGGDPRRQAAIWIYRDGRLWGIIVDTDGDGSGNFGLGS